MKIRWEEDSSIYGLDLVGVGGLIGSPLIYLTTGAGSFWKGGGRRNRFDCPTDRLRGRNGDG